ncbi:hypothetical protein XU18_2579 [Perkinsela sp. CCAP 1560/4]|nr:hypothetical protein XU18_2579 [Perkinsela sp. CCAP 1560/4]|eukprot:KNH06558.1 hypothetical protein XU18_2579 [Perkinsela sp. CCAP 1560/4]
MTYLEDNSVGNYSLWRKAETAIIRELFRTVEWRAQRTRWRIRPTFLQSVQQEIFDRLQVRRSLSEIHTEIRKELKYRQERRAMKIVSRFLVPKRRSTEAECGLEKTPKKRWERWWVFMKDQIGYQPMYNDIPFRAHFAEEQKLLEAFTIPLNEIISSTPARSQPHCPVSCNFLRLMGVSCAESTEIYQYALAASGFILKYPDITIREIGVLFVERYPRARSLLAAPLILDYIIEAFCAMLDVKVADADGRSIEEAAREKLLH